MKEKALLELACDNPGTRLQPKGDGRVEIPRSITFLMGWNRRRQVNVLRSPGSLYLTVGPHAGEGRPAGLAGSVKVSMDRVRIPLSCLKQAGLDGVPVVATPEIGTIESGVVVVRQDLRPMKKRLAESLEAGKKPGLGKGFYLLLPSRNHPTIIRPLGKPFRFFGAWEEIPGRDKGRVGLIHPQRGGASPLFIVPVLHKERGDWHPAWLLAQPELLGEIQEVVRKRANIPLGDYDMIVWHQPFSPSWFTVFANPANSLPQDVLEQGRNDCGDPQEALRSLFKPLGSGRPGSFPMRGLLSEYLERDFKTSGFSFDEEAG